MQRYIFRQEIARFMHMIFLQPLLPRRYILLPVNMQHYPAAPQMICANCKGHVRTCEIRHKFDSEDHPVVSPAEAWSTIIVIYWPCGPLIPLAALDLDGFRHIYRLFGPGNCVTSRNWCQIHLNVIVCKAVRGPESFYEKCTAVYESALNIEHEECVDAEGARSVSY